MTGHGITAMCVLLDNVFGGVDEGMEAGYRYALEDFDDDVIKQVVDEFIRGEHRRPEDVKWLPKAPEIAARARQILREQGNDRRIKGLLAGIRRQLESGRAG